MKTRVLGLALVFLALNAFWPATGSAISLLGISSPGFKDGEKLPRYITCDGGDHSPALNISDLPKETKSLAVLMTELGSPKGTATLWMVYNIPPSLTSLPENLPHGRTVQKEILQLPGTSGKVGYAGPCPPSGVTRNYQIEVFALDGPLDLPETSGKREFLEAIEGHILAMGRIAGKYKH